MLFHPLHFVPKSSLLLLGQNLIQFGSHGIHHRIHLPKRFFTLLMKPLGIFFQNHFDWLILGFIRTDQIFKHSGNATRLPDFGKSSLEAKSHDGAIQKYSQQDANQ